MNAHLAVDRYIDGLLDDAPAPIPTPTPPAAVAVEPMPLPVVRSSVVSMPVRVRAGAAVDDALAEPARHGATPAVRSMRWLCFELAGQSYAMELLKVQEVQRVPDIVPVRGAAPDMLGVINLRGQIVHVIDLAHSLGFGACDASALSARVMVLEQQGNTVGLLVSAVTEVATLDESRIERAAAALPAFPRHALIGIARHAGTMTGLLDANAFLHKDTP